MLVETANSGIAWTEPRDLPLEALSASGTGSSTLLPSSYHGNQSDFFCYASRHPEPNAAAVDGFTYYLPPGSFSAKYLPRLLQIGGYDPNEVDAHGTTM